MTKLFQMMNCAQFPTKAIFVNLNIRKHSFTNDKRLTVQNFACHACSV